MIIRYPKGKNWTIPYVMMKERENRPFSPVANHYGASNKLSVGYQNGAFALAMVNIFYCYGMPWCT